MKKLLISCLILGLILSLVLPSVPAFGADQGNAQDFAPDHILVKFKAGTDEAARQQIHRGKGGSVIDEIPQIGVQVVRIPAGKVPEKVLAYRSEKAVEFAEPDFIAEAIGDPNDPDFGKQWGMTQIQAPDAWVVTKSNANIKIAILDTGVDQDHEDLAGKIVDNKDDNKNFSSSSTVDDNYGHGTHVAGIAAAATNNGIGVAGVGYNCSIMNGKVLSDSGSGYYSWVANGITWAANNGAKAINMSLGGSGASSALKDAIDYAWGKGVVIVAAAGNSNSKSPMYPAYYPNCIAVAATDQSDKKASFSNYGDWVDVAAPGVSIYSTLPNHSNKLGLNYGYLSGTSMATPHVAGLAALVWATGHGTSNAAVRSQIENTADQAGAMWSTYGIKRINAYEAVEGGGTSSPSLSVSVSAPSLITTKGNFTVEATVTNSGDETATGVTATIDLPSGLSIAEGLMQQTLGNIGGGKSATASWSVTDEKDGEYTITVDADADNADPANDTATVTVDTTPPAQVTGLAVTPVSSSQLNLSWNKNPELDLDHYNVYRSTVSGGTYDLIASPTAYSYSDTGLAAATTYYYVVSAVDTAGNDGIKSAEASGTTSEASTTEMYVDSIDVSLYSRTVGKGGKNTFYWAVATVTIIDAGGVPVEGATVYGSWGGATSGTSSAVTNASGEATLTSSSVKNADPGTTFIFTVDDVTKDEWTYVPSENGDSGSTTIGL